MERFDFSAYSAGLHAVLDEGATTSLVASFPHLVSHVVLSRSLEQMFRAAADPVVAVVADNLTWTERTIGEFVGDTVSQGGLSLAANPAVAAASSLPFPTTVGLVDSRPETLGKRLFKPDDPGTVTHGGYQ